ncbi:hypothetical protein ACIBF6_10605 [Streptosporangium amethystogenes]|uniref:hypothetical protein n=1 Tax=Streptosporangium amethystogenes TaxID=2002 RepID=UPI003790FC46
MGRRLGGRQGPGPQLGVWGHEPKPVDDRLGVPGPLCDEPGVPESPGCEFSGMPGDAGLEETSDNRCTFQSLGS